MFIEILEARAKYLKLNVEYPNIVRMKRSKLQELANWVNSKDENFILMWKNIFKIKDRKQLKWSDLRGSYIYGLKITHNEKYSVVVFNEQIEVRK